LRVTWPVWGSVIAKNVFFMVRIMATAVRRWPESFLTAAPGRHSRLLNKPTTLRGAPRWFVATIFHGEGPRKSRVRKTPGFIADSSHQHGPSFRGTAIAFGAMAMTNTTEYPVAKEEDASVWLEAHGDYLFNLAVGQMRDASVAEDLVQETFLAALKARDQFRGGSSDRTWLVGILRHKIYDHLRRVCRERPVRTDHTYDRADQEAWDDSVLWLNDAASECAHPGRRMELAEMRSALEAALGKLPPRIAQVFHLYEVEERPNREVCEKLAISESNLWVMLHRARKQLRKELAGWWEGGKSANRPATFNQSAARNLC
jgi:RNA polymerase sigma-70 factor (ECF subfamily)